MKKQKELSDRIKKQLKRFQKRDHPLFGEIELPHQKNEFKPEEIVDIEQEAPLEYISKQDIYEAEVFEQTKKAASLLKEEPPVRNKINYSTFQNRKIVLSNNNNSKLSFQDEINIAKILTHIKKTGHINTDTGISLTAEKKKKVNKYFKYLTKNQQIEKFGSGKFSFYKLK